jgi:hypothetical protein
MITKEYSMLQTKLVAIFLLLYNNQVYVLILIIRIFQRKKRKTYGKRIGNFLVLLKKSMSTKKEFLEIKKSTKKFLKLFKVLRLSKYQ